MDVGVRVFRKQIGVSHDGSIDFVLDVGDTPGVIDAGRIMEADGELVEIGEGAGDGLAAGKSDGDFGFGVTGKEHLLFELETAKTGGDVGEIAGGRVAGRSSHPRH